MQSRLLWELDLCQWGSIAALAEVGQVSVTPEEGLGSQDISTASSICCSFSWQGAFLSYLQVEDVRVRGVWDR